MVCLKIWMECGVNISICDLKGGKYKRVILEKCRGLKVGQESRRALRQALSPSRRNSSKKTVNWYVIHYLRFP